MGSGCMKNSAVKNRDSGCRRPIIAITMGDPAGIGAEIAVKALADSKLYDTCKPFVIGDSKLVKDALGFTGINITQQRITKPGEGVYRPGVINVIDLDNIDLEAPR